MNDPDTEQAAWHQFEQECHRWQTERNNEFEEYLDEQEKDDASCK